MPGRGRLRIIGGAAGGRVLRGPHGTAVRPSSARLREAVFAIIEAAGIDLSSVLDLYAGTGALGIEALSRGADRCTFVEADRRAASIVRENLVRAGCQERATVRVARVGRWRPPEGARFSLVLADPPYDDAGAWADIERAVAGAVGERTTIVVEHAARVAPPSMLAGLPLWRRRRYGDGAVAVYRLGETPARGEDA